MTKEEKKRVAAIVELAECLFLENLALKLVLEYREVANWQKLVEKLMDDQELLAGVHLKFQDLPRQLERMPDPSAAIDALLGLSLRPKKPH